MRVWEGEGRTEESYCFEEVMGSKENLTQWSKLVFQFNLREGQGVFPEKAAQRASRKFLVQFCSQ